MKTIAEQMNAKNFPFEMFDKNGNQIYYEDVHGYWVKYQYKHNNQPISFANSKGVWYKIEYDLNNNEIYYESSTGTIRDNRPKQVREVSMAEVEEAFGCVVKIKK